MGEAKYKPQKQAPHYVYEKRAQIKVFENWIECLADKKTEHATKASTQKNEYNGFHTIKV